MLCMTRTALLPVDHMSTPQRIAQTRNRSGARSNPEPNGERIASGTCAVVMLCMTNWAYSVFRQAPPDLLTTDFSVRFVAAQNSPGSTFLPNEFRTATNKVK